MAWHRSKLTGPQPLRPVLYISVPSDGTIQDLLERFFEYLIEQSRRDCRALVETLRSLQQRKKPAARVVTITRNYAFYAFTKYVYVFFTFFFVFPLLLPIRV